MAEKTQKQKFRAVLKRDGTSLGWTIARIPFDPTELWPNRNRLRVQGTINGFAFRTSLFGSRADGHVLLINKQMQKGAGAALGDTAEFVLEPDVAERIAAVPSELSKLLKQEKALRTWYAGLSYSIRKWIADMISQPKSAAARMRRAEQIVERMLLAMEGEEIPPPILEAAFHCQPRAREGWLAMTPTQRRGHLMGIFYYQTPQSRQKRADKAIAEAIKVWERNR